MAARRVEPPLSGGARRAARLGMLGGSFDPPHLGHLHAARRARTAFALDHVVFVPAARPPHKPERFLAGSAERLAMLALLLEGEPDVSVWGIELERSGPSYTIDTLRELRELAPEPARLFLILGEDNLVGFERWRAVEDIVRLAQPIVVHRRNAGPGAQGSSAARASTGAQVPAGEGLSDLARTRLAVGRVTGLPFDVSSTELREALGRGELPATVLTPLLADYVRAHGLYRS